MPQDPRFNWNPKDKNGDPPLQANFPAGTFPNTSNFPLRSVEWDPLNDPMNKVVWEPDQNALFNGGRWLAITPEDRQNVRNTYSVGKPDYSVSWPQDVELPNKSGKVDPRLRGLKGALK